MTRSMVDIGSVSLDVLNLSAAKVVTIPGLSGKKEIYHLAIPVKAQFSVAGTSVDPNKGARVVFINSEGLDDSGDAFTVFESEADFAAECRDCSSVETSPAAKDKLMAQLFADASESVRTIGCL